MAAKIRLLSDCANTRVPLNIVVTSATVLGPVVVMLLLLLL